VSGVADPTATDSSWDNILYLMLAPPENIQAMNIAVMKKILNQGCTPLIITVNQPYKVLTKTYTKEGIDTSKIYVIDTVTQYSGGVLEENPRVKYVNNPSNLTDLGIAISEVLKQIPDTRKCIIFDSVSMLLIHIPSATASKFFHFVVNKLKLSEVSGIFLCVEKGLDPVILSQMSAFVDKIVDFEPGTTGNGR
jgi:KaiC/GvpD/RAD55 family RecA-like ATPase